jgi:hypothetical protein
MATFLSSLLEAFFFGGDRLLTGVGFLQLGGVKAKEIINSGKVEVKPRGKTKRTAISTN